MENSLELTIVMPCLNEAETLEVCIKKAKGFLESNGVSGEVLIADNGSTDGSQEIAERNGARVVHVKDKGYGSALNGGIMAAYGKYVIMGDADDSYDFVNLMPYVEKLREGYDLVMGNRFKGGIKPGAMPFLHKYLGNPVLSFIGKLFFGIKVNDFHCGLRGFSKDAYHRMNLKTTGMEFASEMVVKAALLDMKMIEVPTVLSPDGRSRPPHLRTWRDGWRHLRFLLMYSPKWLFLYPGIIIALVGLVLTGMLAFNPITVGSTVFDVHTMLYTALMALVGYQFISFYTISKVYATSSGLLPSTKPFDSAFKLFNLERGLILGVFMLLAGFGLTINAIFFWQSTSFGDLVPAITLREVIPAVLLITIGVQTILNSFILSILELKK